MKKKTRNIKVDYLARVEGEGALHIKIKDDKVSDVKLKIFDILGREIIELVNEVQYAGQYNVELSPSKQGLNLSSGIYLYQLITPERILTKKMILLN